jgi:hypothetical protein
MVEMSEAGIRRKLRRRYLIRSYRVQSTFFATGIFIPIATGLLVRHGLSRLALSWDFLADLSNDAHQFALDGIRVVQRLESSHSKLQTTWADLGLQILMEDQQQTPSSVNDGLHNVSDLMWTTTATDSYPWCPNANAKKSQGNEDMYQVEQFNSILSEVTTRIHSIVNGRVVMNTQGLTIMASAIEHIESSIEWTKTHDWLFKALLMVLNVLTIIVIVASFAISKLNFVHHPSRCYLAWIVVPLWTMVSLLLVYATAMVGVGMLLNADFCAGGPTTISSSPIGAMEDAILANRFGNIDRDYYYQQYHDGNHNKNNHGKVNEATGGGLLVYEAFSYYASVSRLSPILICAPSTTIPLTLYRIVRHFFPFFPQPPTLLPQGCLGDFPLAYLGDFQSFIAETGETVSLLAGNIQVNDTAKIDLLGQYCGADLSPNR